MELHALDLEGTKRASFGSWSLMTGAGLRYGTVNQNYSAYTRNAAGATLGSIAFRHNFEGVGPTVSFEARRATSSNFTFFSSARASVLFGSARSNLVAVETTNLAAPRTTRSATSDDDVLPIGEIQVGVDWRTCFCSSYELFLRCAMEGQIWQDAGSASSLSGDVGLFGLNAAFGVSR